MGYQKRFNLKNIEIVKNVGYNGHMDILKRAVQVELERIENIIKEYELELENLPDGYLSKKTINGKVYYYLQNRKEGKIVSNYIGKEDCDIELISQRLEKRKHIEIMLKALNKERKKAERMLEAAK